MSDVVKDRSTIYWSPNISCSQQEKGSECASSEIFCLLFRSLPKAFFFFKSQVARQIIVLIMNFIGSQYQGQKTKDLKRFHGLGQYTFPNGDRYVGGFYDGCFHGYGVVFYRMRESELADKSQSSSTGSSSSHKINPRFLSKANSPTPLSASKDEEKKDEEVDELLRFLDKSAPPVHEEFRPLTKELDEEEEQRIVWQGQYRGIWDHGKNVVGCYVFADGLVYGGRAMKDDSPMEVALATEACAAWPYCQCSDHRLWAEHLRNITPVLPYEAVYGGVQRQQEYKEYLDEVDPRHAKLFWADMPILVPSSCEQEMIPSSFAGGQPRGGKDVVNKWWRDPAKRRQVVTALALPTDPLVAEEDPDHYDVMATMEATDQGRREDSNKEETEEKKGALYASGEKGQPTSSQPPSDDSRPQSSSVRAEPLGRTVENPNLQVRYPVNITDGNRTLTPCVPRYGAPTVYCTGIRRHDPERAEAGGNAVKEYFESRATMPDAVLDDDTG